ncbi:MAG: hypothetical protein PHY02_04075 [Phycisphaerae bacterium]|nr:hypothetical protein [Phycisphaerae bacterium]
MTLEDSISTFANFLKEQDTHLVTVEGINWYGYSGFMMPAYLPHCTPAISESVAEEVLKISGLPFVRWDAGFGKVVKETEWWYVLKRGPWDIENVKDKKKRWMIRQGGKRFSVHKLTFNEALSKCPKVAQLAAERYKGQAKVESREILEKRIQAAQKVPGVLEYIGCFYEDTLVSYSENYIQNNAVWLANIRHDPAYLNKYSSYGLMDGILDYYLNQKKMDYVLDGCRSIHHRTSFQKHLTEIFGFTKEYAVLKVKYSTIFKIAVKLAYPFRNIFWALSDKWINTTVDNISAILRQEYIRRSCADL